KILGEALKGKFDHAIGGCEYRLRRTIISVEGNNVGGWVEGIRKVEDVADGSGAEGIDGLRVIANHRQTQSIGLQRKENRGLKPVGILIFVDQYVVEPPTNILR